ncbi:GDPmannose 4,6-dehydratase [Salinibacterium amurskyense]|uniref:GDP-mannose 4,6-dehydratase n=1 Tax=Salinibacterium amurskyense TaxID=205941 RepID=A0A2M9D7X2_9MICO|nr:GDP-mannose 4,6-dehydratase [Salinibacterium amurskyense]PJJ81815.1 GDPmannose 4,6-dehydratase [Salinibacterium amurskyense]RLQ81615.1 GDP-mannose 4,6-dehydratase [Salinibacterium amurskyense]GHD79207.1 GDP-mannose 4,6-dehydratase [Salinibacterium amurskyense]
MTRALITGVTGQDGSYLAELLLAQGYEVHGVTRDAGEVVTPGVIAHELDLSTDSAIGGLITELQPREIYNLAALSSVFQSWQNPTLTARLNGAVVAEMLAAVKTIHDQGDVDIRFVQASSAEIFGTPTDSPQHEGTPVRPTSPYGAAKAYAHGLVGAYRTAGVAASSLILYNHESPRRPETFVTRKITAAAARISRGLQDTLELGNMDARRDWGWAPDYADALVRAAQHPDADDFVIATGISHSVRDFVAAAFERAGVEDWADRVTVADSLLRTGDAALQRGDASKAQQILGWTPTVEFDEIVAAMVDHDLALLT